MSGRTGIRFLAIKCRRLDLWETAICLILAVTPVAAGSFGGYECTDCSSQKAGYEFAEEQGVTDKAECDAIWRRWAERADLRRWSRYTQGRNPFYEGCLVYVDDPDRGAKLDDDGAEIE